MKKIFLFIIFVLHASIHAQQPSTPSSFSLGTYAINNYEDGLNSLHNAISSANVFSSTLYSKISTRFPGTTVSITNYQDSLVTLHNFLSSTSRNFKFVYYYGHGNVNLITMWNNSFVRNTDSGIGVRNTYWVMLHSCLVFRNNYASQDPWFDGVFKGVHSILGHSSSFITDSTSISTANIEFVSRWVYNAESIWNAYKKAITHQIHENSGKNAEPKIVYRYGNINGEIFEPWTEKYANSYQAPIFYNNDYLGIGSRWITLGNPTY